ncbi:MAG: PQQ-like beta-propeller repeat protein [Candidatus Bathyarchaeota archaeon]|nr:PQQ-like beta-propeller repeat protein [Candidatus Bathyarchaeota archaeon]
MILLIAFSTIAASISFADAHDPAWQIQPYLYITATPNPVGVGQQATVVFWLNYIPPTAMGSAGDRWIFYLDITKPDNTTETVGPLTSDSVGGSYYLFTPEQIGKYSFTARFGPQVLTGSNGTGIPNTSSLYGGTNAYLNDTFLSASGTTSIVVQEEQLPTIPTYPLPTDYWTRPIEGQNEEWYTIASNWLGFQQAVRYQADGTAPNSAHIMWTKTLIDGGVVGGTNTGTDGITYYDGTAYEGRFGNPLVINGRLYYAVPRSDAVSGVFGSTTPDNGYACVDLRTGEVLYTVNATMPKFGQLYDYESFNQHGVIPNGYLWSVSGSTWTAYDSLTGNWLFTLTNVPSGAGSSLGVTTIYGSRGEILYYQLNNAQHFLALWNNTAASGETAATSPADTTSTGANQWRPVGKTINASLAYSWNVTIPTLPGTPSIVKVIPDDMIIGTSSTFANLLSWGTPDPWTMWAISLKPESMGQLLWLKNYTAPTGNQTLYLGPVDATTRTFTVWSRDGLTVSGYSIDNGAKLWTSEPEDAWGFYSTGFSVADGLLYHSGYGTIYCYDLTDGSTVWNFSAPSGLATPYTNYPLGIQTVADGKVFVGAVEHSRNAPYWKDSKVFALNATTGDVVWSLDASTPSGALGLGQETNGFAIADGYYSYLNLYDMQIYTIGKGPSQTSITASPKVSVQGSSVLIEGTVIDLATGTTQNEQAARFPTGVPAVSDESMSDWMQYVYMQKPMPTDVTGVNVQLAVIDANGNYRSIGEATSDANGHYSYQWCPDITGKYTIIATFAGTESYYPSHSETAVAVDEPAPTTTPTPAPVSIADEYFIPAVVGIIVIIAIGFAMTILVLKKRP